MVLCEEGTADGAKEAEDGTGAVNGIEAPTDEAGMGAATAVGCASGTGAQDGVAGAGAIASSKGGCAAIRAARAPPSE